jgi:hypothetical protein
VDQQDREVVEVRKVLRIRLSPSMAVAFVALSIALGGSSYAVVTLPARSVATRQLRNDAVTGAKIRNNAVDRAKVRNNAIDGSKVADDSLSGADIAEGTLTGVGSAQNAAHAAASDSSAALDKVAYRTAGGTVPPAPSATAASNAAATAGCDPGQHAVGGGAKVEDLDNTSVIDSFPDAGGSAWTGHVDNADAAGAHPFTVYVICVASAATG